MLSVTDVSLDLGGGLNLPTLGFTLLIAVVATLLSGTGTCPAYRPLRLE
jgi:hypothetical protein